MRRIPIIVIWCLFALGIASSCHRTPGTAEQRLIALDSLIAHSPDSALRALRAIDPAMLGDADQAYHALLTVQAMYKSYEPATSDSLIGRAWQFFSHHGAHDRRVRAMLYHGTVDEELGYLDEAIEWYKQADDHAAADDHGNRGFALLRLASLYHDQNPSDTMCIHHYKTALRHYTAIADTNYQLVCLTSMGAAYRTIDYDSAASYVERALTLSRNYPDLFFYHTNLVVQAGLDLMRGNWRAAADTSLRVLANGSTDYNTPERCRLQLARAYVGLGKPDSALLLLPTDPCSLPAEDQVTYYATRARAWGARGDSTAYFRDDNISCQLADSILNNSLQGRMRYIETQYEQAKVNQMLKESRSHLHTAMVVSALVMLLIVIAGLIVALKLTKRKASLEQAQSQVLELSNQIEHLEISEQEMTHAYENLQLEQQRNNLELKALQIEKEQLSAQLEDSRAQNLAERTRMAKEQKRNEARTAQLEAHIQRIKEREQVLAKAEEEHSLYMSTFSDFCSLATRQLDIMHTIASKAHTMSGNPTAFLESVRSIISADSDPVWVRLRVLADRKHPGVMAKVMSAHPQLTKREQLLIIYLLLDFKSEAIATAMGWSNSEMVSRHKYNLSRKMQLNTSLTKYLNSLRNRAE